MTMAILTRSRRGAGPQPPGQAPHRLRRRSVPLAAGGVVLVVVCALVFAEGWLAAGHRQPVLALAQPVAAGQVITAADLETVRVSAAGPVSLVPASRQDEVVGSTAAVITCPAATGWARARTGCRCPAASQPSAKTSAQTTTSTTPPAASGTLRRRPRRGPCPAG